MPYVAKARSEKLGITVPELDLVACGRTRFEPDGVANDKRSRLGAKVHAPALRIHLLA